MSFNWFLAFSKPLPNGNGNIVHMGHRDKIDLPFDKFIEIPPILQPLDFDRDEFFKRGEWGIQNEVGKKEE